MEWNDGNKYEGNFSNNTRDGMGTFTFPNGDKYHGEFEKGVRNGNGTYVWHTGEKFEGKFDQDSLSQGKVNFEDLNITVDLKIDSQKNIRYIDTNLNEADK